MRGAENPKYRQAAESIARKVGGRPAAPGRLEEGKNGASYEETLGEGRTVRCFSDSAEGDLSCLLLEGERTIGHVLAKDAGMSDEELGTTIQRLFPGQVDKEGEQGAKEEEEG